MSKKYNLKYLEYRVEGSCIHSSFITTGHIGNGVYSIKFDDGWESTATSSQLRSGLMKSPYYPNTVGVGYIGEGEYSTKDHPKIHQVWRNMLERCYRSSYKEYHLYGERGVKVCDDWLNFQNFADWYTNQGKYGYSLDKDLKGSGYLYSPNSCTLLPAIVNSFITNSTGRRKGNLYTGVYPSYNKFKTHCCQLDGKVKYLGSYDSPEEAYKVYEKEKIHLARELANEYRKELDKDVIHYLVSFEKHVRRLTVNPYNSKGE